MTRYTASTFLGGYIWCRVTYVGSRMYIYMAWCIQHEAWVVLNVGLYPAGFSIVVQKPPRENPPIYAKEPYISAKERDVSAKETSWQCGRGRLVVASKNHMSSPKSLISPQKSGASPQNLSKETSWQCGRGRLFSARQPVLVWISQVYERWLTWLLLNMLM